MCLCWYLNAVSQVGTNCTDIFVQSMSKRYLLKQASSASNWASSEPFLGEGDFLYGSLRLREPGAPVSILNSPQYFDQNWIFARKIPHKAIRHDNVGSRSQYLRNCKGIYRTTIKFLICQILWARQKKKTTKCRVSLGAPYSSFVAALSQNESAELSFRW